MTITHIPTRLDGSNFKINQFCWFHEAMHPEPYAQWEPECEDGCDMSGCQQAAQHRRAAR